MRPCVMSTDVLVPDDNVITVGSADAFVFCEASPSGFLVTETTSMSSSTGPSPCDTCTVLDALGCVEDSHCGCSPLEEVTGTLSIDASGGAELDLCGAGADVRFDSDTCFCKSVGFA